MQHQNRVRLLSSESGEGFNQNGKLFSWLISGDATDNELVGQGAFYVSRAYERISPYIGPFRGVEGTERSRIASERD